MRIVLLALGAVLLAAPALADPCEAIPDRGRIPPQYREGAFFAGPVVYVGDGDSLCVDVEGVGPSGWVEVRLADFYAPELNATGGRAARDALVRIARDRRVECIAGRRSWDRIVGVCTLAGRSLGQRMRDAGVAEGGRGRRALFVEGATMR